MGCVGTHYVNILQLYENIKTGLPNQADVVSLCTLWSWLLGFPLHGHVVNDILQEILIIKMCVFLIIYVGYTVTELYKYNLLLCKQFVWAKTSLI
jgi:hypothetical protein